MNRKITRSALTTALVLSLAACGGGDDDDPTLTEPTAAATSGASRPAPPPSAAASTTSVSQLTRAQASAVLISARDLPAGYTLGENEEESTGGSSPDKPECQTKLDGLTTLLADNKLEVVRTFENDSLGSSIEQSIGQYASASELEDALDDFEALTDECPSFTSIDGEGSRASLQLNDVDVDDLGDQMLAYGLSGNASGFPFAGTITIVRKGSIVIQTSQSGLGTSSDSNLVEKLTKLALSKLP